MNSASEKSARHIPRQAKRIIKREYDRAVNQFRQLNYLKTKASIKKVLDLDPENPAAITLLARIAFVTNDYGTAEHLISNMLINNPSYVEAHKLLGDICVKIGFFDKAEQSYQKAIKIRPNYPDAHYCLGLCLMAIGQYGPASVFLRNAATLKPDDKIYWTTWANCLSRVAFVKNDEFLHADLLTLLKQKTISPGPFVRSIISALHFDTEYLGVFEANKLGKLKNSMNCLTAANSLSLVPLLLRIMVLSPITVPEIENMLKILRRGLLDNIVKKIDCLSSIEFLAALAQLCFGNEYLFEETPQEITNLKILNNNITKMIENNDKVPDDWLLILAAYKPLHKVLWFDQLLSQKWPEAIQKVITQQVIEPMKESSLRALVPKLTSINDSVSHAVLQQYEENPYPVWVRVDLSDKARSIDEILTRHNIYMGDIDFELFKSPEVLIAGCGTGKQSLNAASKYLYAKIKALDLSCTSLAYAMRKSQELGFKNIEYYQGDILELSEIEQTFDIIECTGVLHHMKDPMAGWKVLNQILSPGGLMRIALYSEIGRESIKSAQDFISERGFGNSVIDIRRCRKEIIKMAENDPNMKYIIDTVDFYSMSGCRDMIFHTQEHRFTLLEIKNVLNSLNLSFLGFELPAPDIAQRFKNLFSKTQEFRSLDCWHKFELENRESFKGMYVFWVQKI